MDKQIVAIFLTLLMIGTIFVISPSDLQVEASGGGGDNDFGLDGDYIKKKTEDLSDIVNSSYIGKKLKKGRAFGTIGERDAAYDIAGWMEEIGLYDPTENGYKEQIFNTPSKLMFYLPSIPLRGKLKVNSMNLKLNDVELEEYHIRPRWEDGILRPIIKSKLTESINEEDLKVVQAPTNYTWFKNFINSLTDFDKFSGESFISFVLFLLPRFEDYYNFSFSELNESNILDKLPWLNNTDYFPEPTGGEDFVYIRENPQFNPNPFYPELPPIYEAYREIFGGLPLSQIEMILWNVKNKIANKPQCKGIILYDHNPNTYDMNYRPYYPLPTIYITGNDGEPINDSVEDYTIDYSIDQEWTRNVDSFNVIGQINGTNTEETDIVCCLYDSWWNQGTADAAIGMGIILAIAKYMKELDNLTIKPKRNVKFIAFGGEEYAMRGAYYYEKVHRKNEKINTIIDLNQLGFTQADPQLTFDVFINKKSYSSLSPVIEEIRSTANLLDRTDNAYDFSTISTGDWEVISDYLPFVGRRGINTLSFMKTKDLDEELMKWKYHHRNGGNNNKGDTMEFYNDNDVDVTAEFIWNVTKYFMINPNCWFKEGYPSYTPYDLNDDGIYDTINVSYKIESIMPKDKIMVTAELLPRNNSDTSSSSSFSSIELGGAVNKTFPLTYGMYPTAYGSENYFTYELNSPAYPITGGLIGNLDGPVTQYERFKVNMKPLINNTFNLGPYLYTNVERYNTKEYVIDENGIDDYFNISTTFNDSITSYKIVLKLYNTTGMINNRPNERWEENISLGSGNYYPTQDSSPEATAFYPMYHVSTTGVYGSVTLVMQATDPDSDLVEYQVMFLDDNGNYEFSGWSPPQPSGSSYTQTYTWNTPSMNQAKVRVRDNKHTPDLYSSWSNLIDIKIPTGCYVNVTDITVLPGQSFDIKSIEHNIENVECWNWTFAEEEHKTESNVSHYYNETGNYTINLSVKDESNVTYFCNQPVTVLNVIADSNANKTSVKPNESISFNDTSLAYNTIVNWTWDFSDGNISYLQNMSHTFSSDGQYNVTLTVWDNESNSHTFSRIIHVDSIPPESILAPNPPVAIGLCENVTLYADFYDNNSGMKEVQVNITRPDGTYGNYSMETNRSHPYDYYYVYNNTNITGEYYYHFWMVDSANNTCLSYCRSFLVLNIFGHGEYSNLYQNVDDRITGSRFMVHEEGTAEYISAYIQTNLTTPPHSKCMIYRVNDSQLVGTTVEINPNTGDKPFWMIYNFSGTKPWLEKDTEYVLTCWSNDTCNLYYDTGDNGSGCYNNQVYGSPQSPISWTGNESRTYSICCGYSTKPRISNVSITSDSIGFGDSTTISAMVTGESSGLLFVTVDIDYPDNSSLNISMNPDGNNMFSYVFDDTWGIGQYNYSIWTCDRHGRTNMSVQGSFNITADASMSICTMKNSYGSNETINLTDPPVGSPIVGYELLDDGDVLHMWNKFDSYYFNTSSGIQLTNHYDEYWSHNVLMLGYYNNDEWNLIYRTDELTGFNKAIETDNSTYVNATLWKDLTYGGYDFRIAVRYHLGLDDNDLTIIPYIENLGDAIPYTLGFVWEINDIQIDMTPEYDYIEINNTIYYLNETLDLSFVNITRPIYCWNDTLNETVICGYEPLPFFEIRENITDTSMKTLYLKWDSTLDYKVQVKSKAGEYNAPVVLGIKIGTLGVNQSKQTELHWYDASQVSYYFNEYDERTTWATNPDKMVNNLTGTHASTTVDGDVELCTENECSGTDIGTISKVELRMKGYYSGDSASDIYLRPVFNGVADGSNYTFVLDTSASWSPWFDITKDKSAPEVWNWSSIGNLDLDVESDNPPFGFPTPTAYGKNPVIRVTYTPIPPSIYNPVPANGSTNVTISPVLNITVSDANNNSMNITWYWTDNISGNVSWQQLGTNNSVGNGTYYQTYSNASVNGQWWYWKVNVTYDNDSVESDVFKFYTGRQSKIGNTGSTNMSGYLSVQMQFYNETSEDWMFDFYVISDVFPRVINASEEFGLDTIFNGLVNSNDLGFGNGTYRVFAEFVDVYGDALVEDVQKDYVMRDWHSFLVTYD